MPTLDFKGKSHIYAHHLTVPYRPLIPDPDRSIIRTNVGGGGRNLSEVGTPDGNLIIHGDNLHALKALLPTHAGRVKCIYIDPPYNTGNENWCYSDRLNSETLAHWFDAAKPVDGEDLERHDKWLCMMWPRLQLLRELLSDDGVIFVSIDDNEQHHLRVIMDEIFEPNNFLATISWQHRSGRSNNAKKFSNRRELVHVYRKSESVEHIRLARSDEQNSLYVNPDDDPNGRWVSSSYVNPATKEERPNLVYGILNPYTNEVIHHPTHAWKYSKPTHDAHVEAGRLYWGEEGNMQYPRLNNYLKDARGIVPVDTLGGEGGKSTDAATKSLQQIFQGQSPFPTAKPVDVVSHFIRISDGIFRETDQPPIVLDSFAGSGTTAHAVLALNKEDGGNRKFIMVECEDYADTITAERVRRVIRGVPGAKDVALREGLGGEFTYCTLGGPITVEGMLSGESMPAFDQLVAYLICCATGTPVKLSDLITPDDAEFDGETSFVYETDRQRFHLFYRPEPGWLSSNEGALNSERAEQITQDAKLVGKSAVVFGPVRYMNSADLRGLGITYCQLPYELSAARAKLS